MVPPFSLYSSPSIQRVTRLRKSSSTYKNSIHYTLVSWDRTTIQKPSAGNTAYISPRRPTQTLKGTIWLITRYSFTLWTRRESSSMRSGRWWVRTRWRKRLQRPLRNMIVESSFQKDLTTVGFEPTPLRTRSWFWRLRPLGHVALG